MRKAMVVFSVVVVVLVGLYAGMTYMGVVEAGPRRYIGEQTFTSLTEAASFQYSLALAAESVNATVRRSELTRQSPPVVTWSVEMPATEYGLFGDSSLPFAYGEPQYSPGAARGNILATMIVVPATLIAGIWWAFWYARHQDRLEMFGEE